MPIRPPEAHSLLPFLTDKIELLLVRQWMHSFVSARVLLLWRSYLHALRESPSHDKSCEKEESE